MKVYSWNMLFRNAEQERALVFIRESDFDIFCLQEVPEDFLARLKTAFPHSASALEMKRLVSGALLYSVILSRFPITSHGRIELPKQVVPWRSKLFVRLMRFFHFTHIDERGSVYADITTPRGTVRAFSLHLTLAHPRVRQVELETIFAHLKPSSPTIICGDFNILESLHITPLNWLFGGTLGDVFFYARERAAIEKTFATYDLTNALRDASTHPISRSQLDHILVSKSFSIKNSGVSSDRFGSDHAPIWAKLT